MNPRFQVSRGAIELIKRFEGYRQRSAQLPDGRWTIGYGHTLSAREGAEVSERDAEGLLLYDIIAVAHAVNENVYTPLSQNQFDALCCFAFNIGVDNFRRSSVLRRVNEGQLLKAAYEMELWRKADFEGERILIDALARRRSAEKALFLKPAGGWTPVPSPVLPPREDTDAPSWAPTAPPVELTTPMTGEHAVAERITPAPVIEPAAPTATEAAASALTAQLSQIMAEPVVAPEAEPEPQPEPQPQPQPEVVAEPVMEAAPEPYPHTPFEAAADAITESPVEAPAAPPVENTLDLPPIPASAPEAPAAEISSEPEGSAEEPAPLPTYAMIGESDFALTPEAETQAEAAPAPEPEPEASSEPEPELFDPARAATPEPAPESEPFRLEPTRALAEANPAPRILIDDTTFDPVETFDASYVDAAKPFNLRGVAPLLGLAVLGLVLFGGGLFWGFSTRGHEGFTSPMAMLGYGLDIVGIGCFAFAVYQLLNRLVGEDDNDA